MCHAMFFFLQQEPLTLRAAGDLIYLLICLGAVGGKTKRRRRRVDAQMESWRGRRRGELFLPP